MNTQTERAPRRQPGSSSSFYPRTPFNLTEIPKESNFDEDMFSFRTFSGLCVTMWGVTFLLAIVALLLWGC